MNNSLEIFEYTVAHFDCAMRERVLQELSSARRNSFSAAGVICIQFKIAAQLATAIIKLRERYLELKRRAM
jgi:hypothetical protein